MGSLKKSARSRMVAEDGRSSRGGGKDESLDGSSKAVTGTAGLGSLHSIEGICDYCGEVCDSTCDELNAISCSFEGCTNPGVYHQICVETYLRSIRLDKQRKTGFQCPRGCSKATKYDKPCPGRVSKSHPIHVRTDNSKKRRKAKMPEQLPALPGPPQRKLPGPRKGGSKEVPKTGSKDVTKAGSKEAVRTVCLKRSLSASVNDAKGKAKNLASGTSTKVCGGFLKTLESSYVSTGKEGLSTHGLEDRGAFCSQRFDYNSAHRDNSETAVEPHGYLQPGKVGDDLVSRDSGTQSDSSSDEVDYLTRAPLGISLADFGVKVVGRRTFQLPTGSTSSNALRTKQYEGNDSNVPEGSLSDSLECIEESITPSCPSPSKACHKADNHQLGHIHEPAKVSAETEAKDTFTASHPNSNLREKIRTLEEVPKQEVQIEAVDIARGTSACSTFVSSRDQLIPNESVRSLFPVSNVHSPTGELLRPWAEHCISVLTDTKTSRLVYKLQDLGFSDWQSVAAVQLYGSDLNQCADWILSGASDAPSHGTAVNILAELQRLEQLMKTYGISQDQIELAVVSSDGDVDAAVRLLRAAGGPSLDIGRSLTAQTPSSVVFPRAVESAGSSDTNTLGSGSLSMPFKTTALGSPAHGNGYSSPDGRNSSIIDSGIFSLPFQTTDSGLQTTDLGSPSDGNRHSFQDSRNSFTADYGLGTSHAETSKARPTSVDCRLLNSSNGLPPHSQGITSNHIRYNRISNSPRARFVSDTETFDHPRPHHSFTVVDLEHCSCLSLSTNVLPSSVIPGFVCGESSEVGGFSAHPPAVSANCSPSSSSHTVSQNQINVNDDRHHPVDSGASMRSGIASTSASAPHQRAFNYGDSFNGNSPVCASVPDYESRWSESRYWTGAYASDRWGMVLNGLDMGMQNQTLPTVDSVFGQGGKGLVNNQSMVSSANLDTKPQHNVLSSRYFSSQAHVSNEATDIGVQHSEYGKGEGQGPYLVGADEDDAEGQELIQQLLAELIV